MQLSNFDTWGVKLLSPIEESLSKQQTPEKNKLHQIEEAIDDAVSAVKKNKSLDEKVRKTKPALRKQKISDEEAFIYFSEVKGKINYDFSYLGNFRKNPSVDYTEQTAKQHSIEITTTSSEEITHSVLNQIITIQKMDTLTGTRTGFIDQGTQEQFNLLKKLSFYEAIIRVNYDLHN